MTCLLFHHMSHTFRVSAPSIQHKLHTLGCSPSYLLVVWPENSAFQLAEAKGPVIIYGMYQVGKIVYKLFKKFMARSVEQKKC